MGIHLLIRSIKKFSSLIQLNEGYVNVHAKGITGFVTGFPMFLYV